MQQLIYFFQKFKYLLLFIVLQCIALFFTFNNLEFHKSKFVSSANLITGSFYNTTTSISSYFNLKSVNKKLVEENVFLRSKLPYNTYKNNSVDSVLVDTTTFYQKFTYTTAKVINNNYTNAFNYLTINKGAKQGFG
jgi:rod shape-determining protein MreC